MELETVCLLCSRSLSGATVISVPLCADCQRNISTMSVEQRIQLGTAINDHLARRYGDNIKASMFRQLQDLLATVQSHMRDDSDPFNLFGGRN